MAISEKQLAANRRNALKSTGPKAAEGRKRCGKRGLKNRLFSREILIKGESEEAFKAHLAELTEQLNPLNSIERGLVGVLVMCSWRRKRIWGMQATAVNTQIEALTADSLEYHAKSPLRCATGAFGTLVDTSRVLSCLNRHEVDLGREYHCTLNKFHALRREFPGDNPDFGIGPISGPPQAPQIVENEPAALQIQ